MQKQKANKKINRESQQTRRSVGKRNQRPRPHGNRKRRQVVSAGGGLGFHLLSDSIRPVSAFQLQSLNGAAEGREDLLSMVNTEAKQLQAIEDLYAIVKAQPKYKTLKEPRWPAETNPTTVIYWLLRKLGPLAKGNNWTIDTYQHAGRMRFRYVQYKHYHAQLIKNREEFMPLDFLPDLKKRDLPLHEMILDLVALVSKYNRVPLWDRDGDFSAGLEKLRAKKFAGRQQELYTTGAAAQYLRDIHSRMKTISPADLYVKLQAYRTTSQRKIDVCRWINKGIRLASTHEHIGTYSYVPNYTAGKAVSPFRRYKFVWSLQSEDLVRKAAFVKLSKGEDYLPVMFSIAKPGQKLPPLLTGDFPVDLYSFMSTGVAIVMWRYRAYFYKEKKTQEKYLIDRLEDFEDAELQILANNE